MKYTIREHVVYAAANRTQYPLSDESVELTRYGVPDNFVYIFRELRVINQQIYELTTSKNRRRKTQTLMAAELQDSIDIRVDNNLRN